jgi:hypothetical protein
MIIRIRSVAALALLWILLRGGDHTMIMSMRDIYVGLIVNKKRTIEQIPASYRQAVLDDLEALGLDGYGNPIQEVA